MAEIGYGLEQDQIGYSRRKKKSHKPLWLMALGVHPRGFEPLTFGSVDSIFRTRKSHFHKGLHRLSSKLTACNHLLFDAVKRRAFGNRGFANGIFPDNSGVSIRQTMHHGQRGAANPISDKSKRANS